MHTIFTTYLINQKCPESMDAKKCPLRKYLKTSDLFIIGQNETMLEPTKELYRLGREEYRQEISHMHSICHCCMTNNNQKTK